VKATEDITVGGLIEAATIRCDRNFVCRRGIAAKERGQLLVRGDAEIGFLENVRGSIGGTLTIRRNVVSCELAVGRDLIAPSAAIIGGRTIVTRSIQVGSLGSPGETLTTLILGAVPFISAQVKSLKKRIHALEDVLREKQERHQMLLAAEKRLSHAEKEQLTEMQFEISEVQHELTRHQTEHDRLVEEMKARGTVDVTVMQVIQPRVRLSVRDMTVVFDRELRGPVRIGWDERQRVVFRQGDTPPRPISDVTHLEQIAA
jgi:uncharacterized protein (DUF342 family)